MIDSNPTIEKWIGERSPSEAEIRERLADEGLSAYSWSNGPGDVYSAHSHIFHKVIYVVKGSITFGLPNQGKQLSFEAGDRLELPQDTVHNAVVGPNGVTCLEAHRLAKVP